LGGVVAFAVNGWDFAAHGAEIGGQLAAVVNGVVQAELEKEDGGLLEHAPEIHDFGELFAGEFGKRVEIFGVGLFVPRGDFARSVDAVRNFDGTGIEGAVDGSFEEEIFRNGDMADQFDGGFGAGIGLVRGLVRRNGFEDFFGGAGFGFQCGKINIVKQEMRLVGGEVGHGESPLQLRV